MATNEKREFVVTPPGRMNWPYLLTANKKNQRTVDLLIPKTDPQAPAFLKRAKALQATAAGAEKIGAKAMYGILDGDTMEDANGNLKKDEHPEYAGCIVVRPKSNKAIQILDENGQEVIDPNEVYAGRWAQLSMDFYFLAYKDKETNMTKKMVCASLRGVKLGRHDEKFSGGMIDVTNDFGMTVSVEDLA